MPNITTLEKVELLLAAFDDGAAIRQAAWRAGVAKATANRYRREWLQGGSPSEIRDRVMAQYFAGREAATDGHYNPRPGPPGAVKNPIKTCARKANDPPEPG